MEEKNLTEKESLALIAGMIQKTKKRTGLDRGKPLLLWGYTSAFTAVLVYIALVLTRDPRSMLLWLLIPLIGQPLQHRFIRHEKETNGEAKSYVDIVSDRLWLLVSLSELIAFAICLGFAWFGYKVWIIMFFYSLIAVGSASTVQGIVIRENSLVLGGLIGVAGGLFIMGCVMSNIALNAAWVMPLFIACFIMMTIIPGHIINHKAKRLC